MISARKPPRDQIQLREGLSQDRAFLFQLFALTEAERLHLATPDSGAPDPLLQHQIEIRLSAYQQQFPDACHEIILRAGESIGQVILNRTPSEIRIVDLRLLPTEQNKGTGSAILQGLLDQAKRSGIKVTLTVASDNADARRLYGRFGFQTLRTDGIFEFMEAAPPGNASCRSRNKDSQGLPQHVESPQGERSQA